MSKDLLDSDHGIRPGREKIIRQSDAFSAYCIVDVPEALRRDYWHPSRDSGEKDSAFWNSCAEKKKRIRPERRRQTRDRL